MIRSQRPQLLAVWLAASFSMVARAQPYLAFQDVPIISTQSEPVFRDLFSRGHCGTVRAIMLGDSQETCPAGLGAIYMPRLNYELFLRYGNVPETPLSGPRAHNGGAPWADFLIRNSNAGPGLTTSRLNPQALPPLLAAGKSSAVNGNNVNGNQWYGGLYLLQHDAAHVDPGTLLAGMAEYFKRGDGVYMDILAATNVSSGEISVRVTPNTVSSPSYYQPTINSFMLDLDLEQETPAIRRARIGPLSFGGRPFMQVELSGSDPGKFTDIIGARFVSSVDDRGWAISSFASGGYQTQFILESHGQCGHILAALEPNVAFLAFGANDFGLGQTPEQFHQNTLALIAFLRANIGESLPIILLADADRSFDGLPATRGDNLDLQSGVLHAIAQSIPGVCAVNSRLLTHQQGWTRSGDLATFMADGVHYTPFGARFKAALEIEALYTTFDNRCHADLDDGSGQANPDCHVDIADLLFFLHGFEAGDFACDLDNDGDAAIATPDGSVDIGDLLFFLGRFEGGC